MALDPARVTALLVEDAIWWSAACASEIFPRDRVWICFACGLCGRTWGRVFRCPEVLYRTFDDVCALVDGMCAGKVGAIHPTDWNAATVCECKSPRGKERRVEVASAALFKAMIGSGAGLVVSPSRALRVADASGIPEAIERSAEGIRIAFSRWLTIFDAEGPIEPGVRILDVPDAASLCVRFGDRFLAIDGAALLAHARAIARRHGADARLDGGRLSIVTPRAEWRVAPGSIARSMVELGRTLPEAVAEAIELAVISIDERIAMLRAMTELVPGSTFEIEGTRATAKLPDGRVAHAIELSDLAPSVLGPADLAREAAFLLDAAPPWADRTRVCPCGAAVTMERRLVPWPWSGARHLTPFLLRGPERGGDPAEVVALACDRHIRIPASSDVSGLGRADIEARIAFDLPRSVQPLAAVVHELAPNARAIVAVGPFAGSLALTDARLAAANDALGAPLARAPGLAWAFGCDAFAIVEHRAPDDALEEQLRGALGIAGPAFARPRACDLGAPPVGRIHLAR